MAIQNRENPLAHVPSCRLHANELLETKANHSLAKHLLAWCEVSEGRVPNDLFDELKEVEKPGPDIPIEANLGWLMTMCHRSHEGLGRLIAELEFDPENEKLQVLVGICLQKTRNHPASVKVLKNVLENSPDNQWARHHYANALLHSGSWGEAFAELEKSKAPQTAIEESFFSDPSQLWTGQDLEGKHIVIVASRCRSTNIFFSRYASKLAELEPKRIGMVCPEEQVELMRTIREINRVDSQKFEPFDYYIPIESLAQRLGTEPDTIPCEIPYLFKSRAWANSTLTDFRSQKPLLGICWRSTGKSEGDLQYTRHLNEAKSLGYKSLRFLLETLAPDYEFLSLQEDPEPEELELLSKYGAHLIDQAEFSEIATLAKSISYTDTVLTVDSLITHLAGSIGKESHVLLPYSADWKWGSQMRTSSWYPNAKLYRQRTENTWNLCLPEAVKALKIRNHVA